jgi:hypothetical protein
VSFSRARVVCRFSCWCAADVVLLTMPSKLDLCRAFVRRYLTQDPGARLPVEALCSRFEALAYEAGVVCQVPGPRVMRKAIEAERMGDLFCDRARRTHIRARMA